MSKAMTTGRVMALAALALALTTARSASAQEELQSSISGEFEIKFGEYLPAVDEEFSGTGPYEEVFGPGGTLYFELEYSFYVWRDYGALAVGIGVGFLSESGKGINADGTESVDDTSFEMLPLRLSLIYRFDVPPREWSIPFVPYLKLGLDGYVWWTTSAAGIATYRDPATDELDEGRGMTFGWHVGVGLQFLLDVLAPAMSRAFDASTGVNNSYLFAEFLHASVDNFGSDESIRLGDDAFLFGLAFEF